MLTLSQAQDRHKAILDQLAVGLRREDWLALITSARTELKQRHVQFIEQHDNWGFRLPEELLGLIFGKLSAVELMRAGLCCKRWGRCSRKRSLWKQLFLRDMLHASHLRLSSDWFAEQHSWSKRYLDQTRAKKNLRNEFYRLSRLVGHEDAVLCISTSNRRIATGSADMKTRLWDYNGRCTRVLQGHTGSVISVSIDAQHVTTASRDLTVKVWETHHEKCLRTIELSYQPIAVAHDEDLLVVAVRSPQIAVRIWRKWSDPDEVPIGLEEAEVMCMQLTKKLLVMSHIDGTITAYAIHPGFNFVRAGQVRVCDVPIHSFSYFGRIMVAAASSGGLYVLQYSPKEKSKKEPQDPAEAFDFSDWHHIYQMPTGTRIKSVSVYKENQFLVSTQSKTIEFFEVTKQADGTAALQRIVTYDREVLHRAKKVCFDGENLVFDAGNFVHLLNFASNRPKGLLLV